MGASKWYNYFGLQMNSTMKNNNLPECCILNMHQFGTINVQLFLNNNSAIRLYVEDTAI